MRKDLGDLPGSHASHEAAEGASSPSVSIPIAELERARRRFCRVIASALILAMAKTDTSIETIAARTDQKPKTIRRILSALMDGRDPGDGLRWLSDIAWSMGCEIEFSAAPIAQGIVTQRDETRSGSVERSEIEPDPAGDAPVSEPL